MGAPELTIRDGHGNNRLIAGFAHRGAAQLVSRLPQSPNGHLVAQSRQASHIVVQRGNANAELSRYLGEGNGFETVHIRQRNRHLNHTWQVNVSPSRQWRLPSLAWLWPRRWRAA